MSRTADALTELHISVAHGSHGYIAFDNRTGEIVKVTPCNCGDLKDYSNILQFDVGEWYEHYRTEMPIHLDILDLGSWFTSVDHTQEYEEPAHEWREERKQMQLEEA